MAIKVYIKNNYLIVEDANVYGEGLAKDVRVNRLYVDIPDEQIQKYSFTNVNNISATYAFRNEDDEVQFLDENGDPYSDEAAFEAFYSDTTGKSSAGGGATQTFDQTLQEGNTALRPAKWNDGTTDTVVIKPGDGDEQGSVAFYGNANSIEGTAVLYNAFSISGAIPDNEGDLQSINYQYKPGAVGYIATEQDGVSGTFEASGLSFVVTNGIITSITPT